jgi:hypothetical protein
MISHVLGTQTTATVHGGAHHPPVLKRQTKREREYCFPTKVHEQKSNLMMEKIFSNTPEDNGSSLQNN